MARRDKGIEGRLFELCETDLSEGKRALLAKAVGQLESDDAVIASLKLIKDNGSPPVPFDVRELIEGAFVEKRPHAGSQNSYSLEPRSSNLIRRALLEMSETDGTRRKSASFLIAQIEEWGLNTGAQVMSRVIRQSNPKRCGRRFKSAEFRQKRELRLPMKCLAFGGQCLMELRDEYVFCSCHNDLRRAQSWISGEADPFADCGCSL